MALASDLAIIGVTSRQADFLGDTMGAELTAAGIFSQVDATQIVAAINEFTTVPASSGARLPRVQATPYSRIIVKNMHPTNILRIYPASGESIDALFVDSPWLLSPTDSKMFAKISATRWISL
jgi:hypothetical protein